MKPQRLFPSTQRSMPSEELLGKILLRIDAEQAAMQKRNFVALILGAFVSCTALVATLLAATSSFSRSGGSAFLKLLVTDTTTVAAYWKDFFYSLLETLPAGGLAAVLLFTVAVAVLLRAIGRMARNFRHSHVFTQKI